MDDLELDSRGFQNFDLSHEPDLPDILNCVLDVSKSEVRTFLILLSQQNADVRTLANDLDRSENTVRENLNVLVEEGLVVRDRRVTKQGRFHMYQAPSLAEMKSLLHDAVDRWVGEASDCVASLEEYPTDDPSLRTVAKVVFGFERPLMECYIGLLTNPRCTARELAVVQDLARSTVSGRLNDLQDRGLACPVGREIPVSTRIAYEYVPRPLDEVKTAMDEQLRKEWAEFAHKAINEFDLATVDYRSQ